MTDVPTPAPSDPVVQAPQAARVRGGRVGRLVHRVLRLLVRLRPRSGRGLAVLIVMVGGFALAAGVGSMMMIHYTETAGFCGRCHTMKPELKAYQLGVHRDVACGECHVNPGVAGFIKAKMNGSKQMYQLFTNTYPTPIEAPDHAKLPPVKSTCLKCHALDEITREGGPVKLVLRTRYRDDRLNTPETVAVVLRPAGLAQGATGAMLGVHWHVQKKVTYTSSDPETQTIDLVDVTEPDGSVKQFIAASQVSTTTTVMRDVQRLQTRERARTMDCLDCHNRIGHDIPSASSVVDEAIASGKLSPDIPFIKRDAVSLLQGGYPSYSAADEAIAGLKEKDQVRYRLLAAQDVVELDDAVEELQRAYRLVNTPGMKVTDRTYPDNLGHLRSPGCFRCHDGSHFLVSKGKLTRTAIPFSCATCHTFPQIGGQVSGVLVGGQPASHTVKDFVFNHRTVATSVNPTGSSCAACHTPTYCVNCHKSGALSVRHEQMLYSHPTAVMRSGLSACAYCHQSSYCATCHKGSVLLGKPP